MQMAYCTQERCGTCTWIISLSFFFFFLRQPLGGVKSFDDSLYFRLFAATMISNSATTPFLDNIYSAYASNRHDSSIYATYTRHDSSISRSILAARSRFYGQRPHPRWVVCIGEVTMRLLRFFPLDFFALPYRAWNCLPHNATAIKFIAWDRTVKRPASSFSLFLSSSWPTHTTCTPIYRIRETMG